MQKQKKPKTLKKRVIVGMNHIHTHDFRLFFIKNDTTKKKGEFQATKHQALQ